MTAKHRSVLFAATFLFVWSAQAENTTIPDGDVTPEKFVAEHVFQTFFFTRSNNPQSHAASIIRQFQDGFRAYKPGLPYVNVGSLSEDCKAILVAFIGEKDFVRKWDGTIEPGSVTATAAVIDLRNLDSSTTRIYANGDKLQVDIQMKQTGGAKSDVVYIYKYAGSEKWQGGVFPLGRTNPFYNVLGGAGGMLFFHIKEEERPEAVKTLKTIFEKCH
jgi:hypothetical protein